MQAADTVIVEEAIQPMPEYILFGMLDDYLGRSFSPPVVENFYPHEADVASVFIHVAKTALNNLAKEAAPNYDIDTMISFNVAASGHIAVENEFLGWHLARKFYDAGGIKLSWGRSGKERTPSFDIGLGQKSIDSVIAPGVDRSNCLKSFLYGAYVRYGKIAGDEVKFKFANSSTKTANVISALSMLGVNHIRHDLEIGCPAVNSVIVNDNSLAVDLKVLVMTNLVSG